MVIPEACLPAERVRSNLLSAASVRSAPAASSGICRCSMTEILSDEAVAMNVHLDMNGDFEKGVAVGLQIINEGKAPSVQVCARLPPAPQIIEAYNTLHFALFSWMMLSRTLQKIDNGLVNNVSFPELKVLIPKLREELITSLNCLLDSESFRPIKNALQASLKPDDEPNFVIQAANMCQICKLPWDRSDLFKGYPHAEVAFSPLNDRAVPSLSQTPGTGRVKILAILGNSKYINIQRDLKMLKLLPDADVRVLEKPDRDKINEQLWEQPWDVLFFAGHSRTECEKGRLYINDTDCLTISQIEPALKKAIAQGLKLAIFNSCDGSGLARQLAELQMPKTIFMREKVPDMVAQVFLMNFLQAFAFDGQSLYLSVNEARKSLQSLESRFPCASWLPAICDNMPESILTWDLF